MLFRVAELVAIITFDDLFRRRPYLFVAIPLAVEIVLDICFAESFEEQGPSLPTDPINVGEVDRPLNGSRFINGANLRHKLLGAPRSSAAP